MEPFDRFVTPLQVLEFTHEEVRRVTTENPGYTLSGVPRNEVSPDKWDQRGEVRTMILNFSRAVFQAVGGQRYRRLDWIELTIPFLRVPHRECDEHYVGANSTLGERTSSSWERV